MRLSEASTVTLTILGAIASVTIGFGIMIGGYSTRLDAAEERLERQSIAIKEIREQSNADRDILIRLDENVKFIKSRVR